MIHTVLAAMFSGAVFYVAGRRRAFEEVARAFDASGNQKLAEVVRAIR